MKKILNNFGILSIICILLLGSTAIHNKTFANNIQQNKCRIIEHKSNNGQYKYDNYGNYTIYKNPFSNIFDEGLVKAGEFIFAPILDSTTSRSIDFYTYDNKRIWGTNCKSYKDCLNSKDMPVYKSFKDKQGNKKDIYTSADGKRIYYWYIYNNKGQKIEDMEICSGYVEKNCYYRNLYTYNSQGKLDTKYYKHQYQGINKIIQSNEHYDKYLYDVKGDLVEHKEECNKDYTKCNHITQCEYNNLGQKIKETWTWNLTKPSITTYKYDAKGNLIVENKCYNSTTNCLKKYEYDSRGNKTKEYIECDNKGNNCMYAHKYEYDNYNNKIATYYCYNNGKKCNQTETIKYECK